MTGLLDLLETVQHELIKPTDDCGPYFPIKVTCRVILELVIKLRETPSTLYLLHDNIAFNVELYSRFVLKVIFRYLYCYGYGSRCILFQITKCIYSTA